HTFKSAATTSRQAPETFSICSVDSVARSCYLSKGIQVKIPVRLVWFGLIGLLWNCCAVEPGSHWAFQPVRSQAPPTATSWSEHPIDAFVSAEWVKAGLRPVAIADRRTLIRRLYFDLLGLPPTYSDTEQFVNDLAPDAWPRLVERVLAFPQYGERWARYW